ncbi:MAG TPA: hypothetical protein VG269_15795 [Tepidisphaeraceae bacterium]|jgi:hypothetical protein|nr:hypothetical protein [Tepidisphaeraceae bacterium]
MLTITFPDRATEKRALGFLLGRFSGQVLKGGDHLVPEAAAKALADQGISFKLKGSSQIEDQAQAPRVYWDFQSADREGRARLNCDGTRQDLGRQQIQLKQGMALLLYCEDTDSDGNPNELRVHGVVEYSSVERMWVAHFNPAAIRHTSKKEGD